MSTYTDASVIITPNGYKANKVYALKPTSGAGDLTFTRATIATRINNSLIEGVLTGVPRLNYPIAGGCPRILIEPQSTNLLQRSEAFDNAYWTSTAAVTADTDAAPDGTTTADTLDDSGAGFEDSRRALTVTSGDTFTFSVFIKKTVGALTHYPGVGLSIGGGTATAYAILNTTAGTAVTADVVAATASVNVSDYDDYWRLELSVVADAPDTAVLCLVYPALSSNGTTLDAAATGSNVFWGAQFEELDYATSYIPTVAATVTRNGEQLYKTGVSALIGQTSGTVFVDVLINEGTPINANDQVIIAISDDTANDVVGIFQVTASDLVGGYVFDGGATQAAINTGAIAYGRHKMAIAYAANDIAFYVDGVQIGTDTSATIPTCSMVGFGSYLSATATNKKYEYNSAMIFTTRLSNAELVTLTTI